MKLIESGPLFAPDVECPPAHTVLLDQSGEDIRTHHVFDKAKITRCETVSVYYGVSPSKAALIQRGITAAYAPSGLWRGPKTLKYLSDTVVRPMLDAKASM